MSNQHLIVTVLLICVCLGALTLYVGLGGWKTQPGANALENVDLTYLENHIHEYENKRIGTAGIVMYYPTPRPTETIGDFVLVNGGGAVAALLVDGSLPIPPENSTIAVEGTVACVYGLYIDGYYYIRIDNWSYYNIELTMSSEKTEYQIGEIINIAFEVKNDGSENLALMHPAAYGVFVFDVYDENNVWLGLWPGGAGCVFTETSIGFGETHSENLEWDQKVYETRGGITSSSVTSLKPGKYYIQGWIAGYIQGWIRRTPSLEIILENTE